MLIYVIPFILLLVIAIFLKKREASKEAEPTTKKAATLAKTNAKKTTTSKKVAQKSVPVKEVVPPPQHATPVPVKIQTNIENLIKERNFFAAEAQINQALKRDNSLHGLYLLLLDIHLQQKDEFAVDQLLNHLRSLELDDILSQAEAKKAIHAHEDSAEKSANEAPTTAPSSLDFTAPVSTPNQTASFDQLQHELTSNKTAELDPALEFDTSSLNLSPAAAPVVEKTVEPEDKADPAGLDFNFSLDSTATEAKTEASEITAKPSVSSAEEVKPLDFTFDLTPSPAETTAAPETTAPESTISEAAAVEAPSLDFNFSTPESAPAVEAKAEPAPDFNFTFESTPAAETKLQPTTEPEVIAAPSIVPERAATFVGTDVDLNDPLVKSFPDLSQVDEIQLNLDLASQYVELGAYDAAKALLGEQNANYSAEQRQRADQLLNRIAS